MRHHNARPSWPDTTATTIAAAATATKTSFCNRCAMASAATLKGGRRNWNRSSNSTDMRCAHSTHPRRRHHLFLLPPPLLPLPLLLSAPPLFFFPLARILILVIRPVVEVAVGAASSICTRPPSTWTPRARHPRGWPPPPRPRLRTRPAAAAAGVAARSSASRICSSNSRRSSNNHNRRRTSA